MSDSATHDELVSAFCGITGASSADAVAYLSAAGWENEVALQAYFEDQEDQEGQAENEQDAPEAVEPAYTGPRTLDGRPAPQSSLSSMAGASSSARKAAPKKKGVMTLSSLTGGGNRAHSHDDDEDNEDEENHGNRGDLFAGGEKSGLAVKDPNMGGPASDAQRVIREIVAKAKANQTRSSEQAEAGPSQPSRRFHGSGQTLGGEGVPSRVIPDESGRQPAAAQRSAPGGSSGREPSDVQERILHIWQDGFSIDDGPLYRFNDPNNAADLQMIRQGRAPLHLMNVQVGQAVDVKLHQHEEAWYQLPRVYRPFSGEGRRLGSPVPGDSTASVAMSTGTATATATPAASLASTNDVAPTVDESQPTLTIRLQLPDGTRLPARFNTTQTIGDVYDFVQRASPATQSRAWVLATTFPNKEHTDRSVVLGETSEFKRGGAAVVKWT